MCLSSAVELRGKKVGQLNVWEAAQKETLLTAQSKSERESDSARLKRTSTKYVQSALLKQEKPSVSTVC